MMMIDPKFIIERQGRSFALYAGLLDASHRDGLKRIQTRLIQVGDEANGQTWIVSAEVETSKGVFSGIGDASPANVSRAMLTCLPRMAETRAKARALRDAVNAGALVALEELAGDDAPEVEHAPTPIRPAAPTSQPASRPALPVAQPASANAATPAQLRAIYSIGNEVAGLSDEQIVERCLAVYGCTLAELSKRDASLFITSLKSGGRRPA